MEKLNSPNCVLKTGCIVNKEMCTVENREKSFENASWPMRTTHPGGIMAKCGFYYTGSGDRVACFFCGITLRDWEKGDNPWIEHALYSNSCSYLLINKSRIVESASGVQVCETKFFNYLFI